MTARRSHEQFHVRVEDSLLNFEQLRLSEESPAHFGWIGPTNAGHVDMCVTTGGVNHHAVDHEVPVVLKSADPIYDATKFGEVVGILDHFSQERLEQLQAVLEGYDQRGIQVLGVRAIEQIPHRRINRPLDH